LHEPATWDLLTRLRSGDQEALAELVQRDLPWIKAQVERRMGKAMLAVVESDDLVQQAFVGFLRSGPRFVLQDQQQFRALMLQIVENTIRREHRDAHRKKRDVARQEPLPSASVIDVGSGVTRPSAAASRDEHRAWVQLALELIDDEQRELIHLREWEGLSFAQMGERLGLAEDAARMRFQRALQVLARTLREIRARGLAGWSTARG
jgi:RNA polymerase sigma-70 factor (ECF subfamily)